MIEVDKQVRPVGAACVGDQCSCPVPDHGAGAMVKGDSNSVCGLPDDSRSQAQALGVIGSLRQRKIPQELRIAVHLECSSRRLG
jgi:hypothetical protein